MATQVILSNWKRPDNLRPIIAALKQQTIPFSKVVLVDNATSAYSCPADITASVTRYWRFPDDNLGPTNRFAPALLDYRPEYTLFLDDDLLPGIRMHEYLLEQARACSNVFATIGQIGRIYRKNVDDTLTYVMRDVTTNNSTLTPVDLTCRAHFVKTADVRHALTMRDRLLADVEQPDWFRHDDILLCTGVQCATNQRSYVLSKPATEQAIIKKNLPNPHAISSRADHLSSRTALINATQRIAGWKSLV